MKRCAKCILVATVIVLIACLSTKLLFVHDHDDEVQHETCIVCQLVQSAKKLLETGTADTAAGIDLSLFIFVASIGAAVCIVACKTPVYLKTRLNN